MRSCKQLSACAARGIGSMVRLVLIGLLALGSEHASPAVEVPSLWTGLYKLFDLPQLAGELSGILTWIEQLNAVDTAGVEPMASVVGDLTLPRRADRVDDGGIADKVLANAPGGAVWVESGNPAAGGFYAVPKIVE